MDLLGSGGGGVLRLRRLSTLVVSAAPVACLPGRMGAGDSVRLHHYGGQK